MIDITVSKWLPVRVEEHVLTVAPLLISAGCFPHNIPYDYPYGLTTRAQQVGLRF
jgi:hypothetical protein